MSAPPNLLDARTQRPAAAPGATAIGTARFRQHVRVRGTVTSIRVVPWVESSPVLECTVFDPTGGITLVFFGRRALAGLELGVLLEAEGRVIEARGRLAMMNPAYTLLGVAHH